MRRWLALTSSVLTGLVVLAVVGVATGAPAQLVQILYGTSVVSNSNPLAVDCVSGCSGGGGGGDVNIVEVGGNPVTTTVPVSGTVASTQSGAWSVEVDNGPGAAAVNIQDGGNSITVDGTVAATQSGTWTVQPGNTANTTPWLTSIAEGGTTAQVTATSGGSLQVECTSGCTGGGGGGGTSSDFGDPFPTAGTAAGFQDAGGDMAPVVLEADGSLPVTVGNTVDVTGTIAATQSGSWILSANSGVDIGDVTINNAGGGAAVNIQDGGNTITVDGTVAATQSGTWNIGTVTAVTSISNALPAGNNNIGDVDVATLPSLPAGNNNIGDVDIASGTVTIGGGTTSATPVPMTPAVSTVSTTITRPNDTNAYAANDAFANSTSAPTTGGFTLSSACRASGGYGTITDAVISASGGTAYQGEIWVFDQATTAVNDNAAFTVSDANVLNLVGVIPFQTSDVTAANAVSYVTGLNIGYTCVGSANLRFLVKIMQAVTPAAQEVLSVRVKVLN